jgi:uncharacterized DUF497 family protein
MDFEWDEAKRLSNLEKHQIDFLDMRLLFDGRLVRTVASHREAENRYQSTGVVNERFVTVIWVWRVEKIRIISARRSRDGEKRAYRELLGGTD